jgi:hypothetical protein
MVSMTMNDVYHLGIWDNTATARRSAWHLKADGHHGGQLLGHPSPVEESTMRNCTAGIAFWHMDV